MHNIPPRHKHLRCLVDFVRLISVKVDSVTVGFRDS